MDVLLPVLETVIQHVLINVQALVLLIARVDALVVQPTVLLLVQDVALDVLEDAKLLAVRAVEPHVIRHVLVALLPVLLDVQVVEDAVPVALLTVLLIAELLVPVSVLVVLLLLCTLIYKSKEKRRNKIYAYFKN